MCPFAVAPTSDPPIVSRPTNSAGNTTPVEDRSWSSAVASPPTTSPPMVIDSTVKPDTCPANGADPPRARSPPTVTDPARCPISTPPLPGPRPADHIAAHAQSPNVIDQGNLPAVLAGPARTEPPTRTVPAFPSTQTVAPPLPGPPARSPPTVIDPAPP